MIFVKSVNLPELADHILLGEKYSEQLAAALFDIGLTPVLVPGNPYVDPRLCGHCDLSVFHAGDNVIFAAEYLKNSDLSHRLESLGFSIYFPKLAFGSSYPMDCPFNICLSGDYLIYNKHSASAEIIDYLHNNKSCVELLCRQGYTKCLVCPVNESSIITSDKAIAAAGIEKGMDVLEISQGYIDLDGYDYGFIGGASFKLSEDRLAFTGTLDQHPDRIRILNFLKERGVEPIFLTDRKIFDVGSILPISEKPR